MRRLKTILQHKYLFKIIALIIVIYALIITNFYSKKSIIDVSATSFKGIVQKYSVKDNKIEIYVKNKETLIGNYYFEEDDSSYNPDIKLGDTIIIYGSIKEPGNNTIPNLFNYRNYLYNDSIYYLMTINKIEKVKNNTSVFYYLKNSLINRINKIKKSGDYVKTFTLAINEIDDNVNDSYRSNGISHLFSISGMHISLFASFFLFVLNKISYNRYFNYAMVDLFLIFFMVLVGFTPSSVRSVVMFILFSINKVFNLKIKSLDIMLILLIILLIINPYYLYSVSFLFSYTISIGIVIGNRNIKRIRNKLVKNLYMSFLCFILSLPICINYFNQVNLLSIVFNLFFIPLVSSIVFPLSILCLLIPTLDSILYIFISIMENVSLFLSNISIFIINFPKVNIVLVLIYYLILVVALYKPKFYIILFLMIILFKNIRYFNNNLEVLYFDVGQGDSALITLPNNRGNILIDTSGDSMNTLESSNVEDKIIPYLKTIGVNKIDLLILTHGDFDHMGESVYLVNNIKVSNVIFNNDSFNTLENELVEVLNNKNIKYSNSIKSLLVKDIKLYFLNTKLYDNENDNSNVVYFKYNNYSFLFMGDAGVDREKEILDKYNLNNISFLKVGHHGSNTSSSAYFINSINPQNCIISVGKYNLYGHPKQSVLDNLANCNTYRTDNDGSIMVSISKNNYKITTYSKY